MKEVVIGLALITIVLCMFFGFFMSGYIHGLNTGIERTFLEAKNLNHAERVVDQETGDVNWKWILKEEGKDE